MKPLTEARVAVVGLGLMGGSIAGALQGHCRRVIGVARRPETVEMARMAGFIHEGTTSLTDGVREADAVILATPVRTILRQLDEIAPFLPPDCLVMDLGSTKRAVLAAMERLPAHVQPLGGHPMCGKERSGLEAADPDLYRGCTFILVPLPRTSPEALALGREIAGAVGARPLVLDACAHDRWVAFLSHLPYLLSCALVAAAEEVLADHPAARTVAASGFRDTSRLAGSDVTMMTDILLTNPDMVLHALRTCQLHLDHIARWIEQGDEDALQAALAAVRRRRLEMSGERNARISDTVRKGGAARNRF